MVCACHQWIVPANAIQKELCNPLCLRIGLSWLRRCELSYVISLLEWQCKSNIS